MVRKATPQEQPVPAKLLQPRNRAREAIVSRIELGASIRERTINNPTDLEEARSAESKWQEFNFELLRRLFTTEEYAAGYRNAEFGSALVMTYGERPFGQQVDDFQRDVKSQIQYLESLAERLDLIDEDTSVDSAPSSQPKLQQRAAKASRRVFIVHGRDEEVKAVVARFVERCGLDTVILHEQADQGRTLIEKFEDHSDVAFAIVLLTPDDVGALKPAVDEQPALQGRARQNVILELGFFLGVLGRKKVVALKKGDLELPSDYAGVIYTPYDAGEGWKLHIARELKAAGLDVDMDAILG